MRIRSISVVFLAVAALAAAQSADAPGPGGAQVSDLSAAPAADAIVVTFVSSDPQRDLLAFWSTAPIASAGDLRRAPFQAALAAGTVRFAVAVPPGVDYWFAVLDAGRFQAGEVSVVPGRNATTRGVRLAAAPASPPPAAAAQRNQPLPALQLTRSVSSGRQIDSGGLPGLPAPRDVSPATAAAIAELLRAAGPLPRPLRKFQLLADGAAGNDPQLRRIAIETLAKGDWSAAERKLKEYVAAARTGEREAAARFYLGQAYWFQGRLRDAYFEFLESDEALPRESRDWQDACLSELARS